MTADDGMGFFRELEKLMSGSGGPVNWNLASQVAVKGLHDNGLADDAPTPTEVTQVTEALALADLWLDPVTALPSGIHTSTAWSRRQWLDATLPVWKDLVDPVAGRVVSAVQEGMSGSLQELMGGGELPPELAGALPPGVSAADLVGQLGSGPMQQMMTQVSGMVFGSQVGQALALLAGIVCSGGEVGLPLITRGTAVLLPGGVAGVVKATDLPADEVRLHLALREAASVRLMAGVPWLADHLRQAVVDYASGIHVDPRALTESLQALDPTDPSSIEAAQGFFSNATPPTPVQEMALKRLETVLALVEGWIEEVVAAASDGRLPHAPALREATRRRRAEGGPAEQTFTALVGLELRPRRVRDAATLWARLLDERGITGRDAVWETPDLLPGADDLDDPMGYGVDPQLGSAESDFVFPDDPMAEIERLEAQASSEDSSTSEADGDEGERDRPAE